MEDDIKYTVKKECPHCRGTDVTPTGAGYGNTKSVPTGGKMPEINNFRFICNKCKKEFYYTDKKDW